MALAAAAAGADGIIVEVHPDPDRAWSDGPQALTPANFDDMMRSLEAVVIAMGRRMSGSGVGSRTAGPSSLAPGPWPLAPR